MPSVAPSRGLLARVALTTAICLPAGCSLSSLDELQAGSVGAASTSASTGGGNGTTSASTGSLGGAGSSSTGGEGGAGGDGAGGDVGGNGGTGGGVDVPPPDLVDTGLLARYFIDESGSGDASGDVQDVAIDPVALSIQDFDDVMDFVTEDGHRGLGWTAAGIRGVVSRGVGTTKFASLNNTVHGTIEVVARVDQASTFGSRLMHIGTSSESSFTLAISHPGPQDTMPLAPPNRLEMRTRGHGDPAPYRYAFFDFDRAGERVVIHAVYDSQETEEDDRIRMYIDGTEVLRQTTDAEARPLLDEQLFVSDDESVTIGNRDIGGRSIEGTIFYAAMYRAPLSEDEIRQNADELLRADDQ